MFERFSDRARRVIVLAQEEARRLRHAYIGTEHLLLGLVREGEGIGARALRALDLSPDTTRRLIEEMIVRGREALTGHIPFTPRAKKVMEQALRESLQLHDRYIGTEHLLLGLLREREGLAAQVLLQQGVDLNQARTKITELREEPGSQAMEQSFELGLHEAETEEVAWPVCPRCRSALEDTARYRILDVPGVDVPGETEPEARAVKFAFCGQCGTWLGTLS